MNGSTGEPGSGWILSTDFDGTLLDNQRPPRGYAPLVEWIQAFRARGGVWAVNTGRELSYLTAGLRQSGMGVVPDFAIVVEREIYRFDAGEYEPVFPWYRQCRENHREVFQRFEANWPELMNWIHANASATLYQDKYSPFSVIADSVGDATKIHQRMEEEAESMDDIIYVHNSIYGRFAHAAYHKGSALRELGRVLNIGTDCVITAGDHFNDISMFDPSVARYWIAPSNAIETVAKRVSQHEFGYSARSPYGQGVLDGLNQFFQS